MNRRTAIPCGSGSVKPVHEVSDDGRRAAGHPRAIVCDLDGTLVDVRGIRHFVDSSEGRDFQAFHQASLECPANDEVSAVLREGRERGLAIVIVTAREERWSFLTTMWLSEHQIPFDDLIMRGRRDLRPDHLVKQDFAVSLSRKYKVEVAIDDRDDILDVWRRAGFATIKVENDGTLSEIRSPGA